MKPQVLIILISLLFITVSCTQRQYYTADYSADLVVRVIDGDTLRLASGEKVRLIGIDTPEKFSGQKLFQDAQRSKRDIRTIQKLGERASAFTKELAEGKKVRLEFDVEKKDRYGRLLAYVFIPLEQLHGLKEYKDLSALELFLNAEIIAQGYAQPMTVPPNVKYADLFRKLYQQARENRRGLWQ